MDRLELALWPLFLILLLCSPTQGETYFGSSNGTFKAEISTLIADQLTAPYHCMEGSQKIAQILNAHGIKTLIAVHNGQGSQADRDNAQMGHMWVLAKDKSLSSNFQWNCGYVAIDPCAGIIDMVNPNYFYYMGPQTVYSCYNAYEKANTRKVAI
jgi:hypothetical protein